MEIEKRKGPEKRQTDAVFGVVAVAILGALIGRKKTNKQTNKQNKSGVFRHHPVFVVFKNDVSPIFVVVVGRCRPKIRRRAAIGNGPK